MSDSGLDAYQGEYREAYREVCWTWRGSVLLDNELGESAGTESDELGYGKR